MKYLLIALLLITTTAAAQNDQQQRDKLASFVCSSTLDDILEKKGYTVRVSSSRVLGEVRPYVFLTNYTFTDGQQNQGYCAINGTHELITPAFEKLIDAIEFVK